MKFILATIAITFLSVTNQAQTKPNNDDEKAARRLMRPALAEALERREAEAAKDFRKVNAFADRFYESWKESLDLVLLDEPFITQNRDRRKEWLESAREFNPPDSLKLAPEQSFQLLLEEYSFLAVGNLLSDRYDDIGPPELERKLVALEEANEKLLSGTEETDPGIYFQKMTRFFREVREISSPYVKHPIEKESTPEVDFPQGVSNEPSFEVGRGPFQLTIQKENGAYRIIRIFVPR